MYSACIIECKIPTEFMYLLPDPVLTKFCPESCQAEVDSDVVHEDEGTERRDYGGGDHVAAAPGGEGGHEGEEVEKHGGAEYMSVHVTANVQISVTASVTVITWVVKVCVS